MSDLLLGCLWYGWTTETVMCGEATIDEWKA